jgi:hypothetical protein
MTERKAPAAADLDDEAFEAELQKHCEDWIDEQGNRIGSRLSDEGSRLVAERHEKRIQQIRDAWRPHDISEADRHPEPLRTVVAFRLLVDQYVAIAGVSIGSLGDHWKRSKLYDLFCPMVDDVAGAMVAMNEDPKGLFRALSLCNETDQMRFVESWRGEVLPTIRTVEIKLKNATTGTATTSNKKIETVSSEFAEVEAEREALRLAQLKQTLAVEQLVALAQQTMSPFSGAAGIVGHQQPAANIGTHVPTGTTGGKLQKNKGGRPPKTERDPDEIKVMKYYQANPKDAWCDIDKHFGFAYGLSKAIYERVTKRERNAKSRDKTGQN